MYYKEMPHFKPDEVLVYLRKSRSDDPSLTVEEVLSRHEGIINEWVERNLEAPIPPENYYREVISGGESIQSRPEFKKLLKRIQTPNILAVVVVELERLGRPCTEEIGKMTNLFRYSSTYVITPPSRLAPERCLDLREQDDREKFEGELKKGADYLDYNKRSMGRGKEISLRSGWYINGVTPYGYERAWAYEGKRERPTLAIVEEEAKVVRMIFDWYANEGIGAMKICQRLNAMGIPSRMGMQWKKSSITNILKNEHYIGKIVIRKHVDVKTVEDFEIVTRKVFNQDFELVDGKHPAILDEELFYRAKNKLINRPSVPPSKVLVNPFASLLKCECGRAMKRNKNRNTFRYLCDEQMFCGNASVNEDALIQDVIKHLKEHLVDLTAKVSLKEDKTKKEKHKERVSLLEARYAAIENKELSLWDKYAEEQMPKQVFDKLMEKCKEEKQNIENELKSAETDAPVHIDYNGAIQTLHQAIEALGDESVSASAKNKLLLAVVDKITYRRPKAIRMTPDEAKAKGVKLQGGWYCPDFELVVELKV